MKITRKETGADRFMSTQNPGGEAPAKKPPTETPTLPPTLTDISGMRERVYEAFDQHEGRVSDTDTTTESHPADEKPEPPKDAVTEGVVESPSEKSDEESEVSMDDEKPDTRTVPYGALKEERERRKRLQDRVDELQKRVDVLIEDNRAMMDLLKGADKAAPKKSEPLPDLPDSEGIEDYDSELIAHRKTIKALRQELAELKAERDRSLQTDAQKKLQESISRVHTELEKESYRGFADLIPVVTAKLYEIGDAKLDNPDGWKKIYREMIYPKIYGAPVPPKDEPKKDTKADAKAAAAKVKPGQGGRVPPVAGPPREDDSWEAYLRERRGNYPG